MARKLTKEEFVERANEVHNGFYSYDKFEYVNAITKSIITCPKHGDFLQSSNTHLSGHGCPKCFSDKSIGSKKVAKITWDIFLERASKIHGDKYRYIEQPFTEGQRTKISIECPKHGEFKQTVCMHLHGGGCQKCASDEKRKKMASSVEKFIEDCHKVHGDRYGYSKVEYVNSKTKVCIICREHGEFYQTPNDHLFSKGCPKCAGIIDKDEFVRKAKLIHNDRYDYSESEYTLSETKLKIMCNKCGRHFYQKPWVHLQGHGCPYCKQSRLEWDILTLLENEGIEYIAQKKFDWLGRKSLDFYLPKYNIAIECQGKQHFGDSRAFGHKELEQTWIDRDIEKKKLCNEHGVEIIYYTNVEKIPEEYIGLLFTDKYKLINYVKRK